MSQSELPEFRPGEILRTLHHHQVAYVVVGGLAAALHGAPIRTGDADIVPEGSPENLARLAAALVQLEARIRVAEEPDGLPFSIEAEGLARGQIWNLTTRYGDLDLTFIPSGTAGYDDVSRDAVVYEVAGVAVRVASLADVIRSKQAANRPKDYVTLPTLRRLLDRLDREDRE